MMKAFLRVADLASFSRAADDLGVPRASLSTAVKDLEEILGSRLLQRTTRKVQMTQDGTVFYERCKDLISDFDEVTGLFRKSAEQIGGRIRFDMPNRLARDLITPRLPEFLAKYPGIEIEMSSTDRRVDMIREGFDCVVRIGPLTDSGFFVRHLPKLKLVNVASPKYIKKYGKPKSIEDLALHKLVNYSSNFANKADGFEYLDGGEYRIKKMNHSITVNNTDLFNAACLAGFGIVQAPLMGVRADIAAGRLIEILPKFQAEPMAASILYPHRRNLARRTQIFIEWLAKHLEKAITESAIESVK